jgi:anthraniloyl-CoA monooxygenase
MSTFIVECSETTWRHAGFDCLDGDATCRRLADIFSHDLGGHELLSNNFVRWLNFLLIKNDRWHHERVVLLGDALHTAHFSIGSGTKLALEDAIALKRAFEERHDVAEALEMFEQTRRPIVERYQEAARESLIWFENVEQSLQLEPLPFAYSVMTRSRRIDRENLRMRDPRFVAAYEAAVATYQSSGRPSS